MRNDVSVIVDSWNLTFFEHQSTLNPNIPFRMLEYCASTLSRYVAALKKAYLYSSKPMKLPEPRFIVLYNGTEDAEKTKVLKLSDLYYNKPEEPMLELIVRQFNIKGYNGECVQLYEYEWLVEKIRFYSQTQDIEQAVHQALNDLPADFTIREFLFANRNEVVEMTIFEYDEKAHMNLVREEGWEDGRAKGLLEGQAKGLLEGRMEGKLMQTAQLLLRKMNSAGMSFAEACALFELSEEETAACKEYIENRTE